MQRWKTTVADNDGDGGRRPRRTTTAADDDGSRNRAADYDGEGRERAVRDSRDSRVAMMAAAKMAAAEDSGGGRQQRWLAASMRAAAADDGVDGSRRGEALNGGVSGDGSMMAAQ
jgi:hypothetical protein